MTRRKVNRERRTRLDPIVRMLRDGFWSAGVDELDRLSKEAAASSEVASEARLVHALWLHANGRFDDALALAEHVIDLDRERAVRSRSLLIADALARTNRRAESCAWLSSLALDRQLPEDLQLLKANVVDAIEIDRRAFARLDELNVVFERHGCAPIELRDKSLPFAFGNVVTRTTNNLETEHKISVLMPAFNAALTIEPAIRSVLEQTWSNLEIIVVDDCSSDATADIAGDLARQDPRVRVFRQPSNEGAYAARNRALREAVGMYITTHDADDWSHSQKLERQIYPLIDDAQLMATVSSWIRISDRFGTQVKNDIGQLRTVTINTSSLMFRRQAMDILGSWDVVRVEADTEFHTRAKRRFGKAAIAHIDRTVPLSFGLAQSTSLTQDQSLGQTSMMLSAISPRRLYSQSHRHWSRSRDFKDDLPWHPQRGSRRPFLAPRMLLSRDSRAIYDAVVVADLTTKGAIGLARGVARARDVQNGVPSIGVVHHPTKWQNVGRDFDDSVWELLGGTGAELISVSEDVECGSLYVTDRWILDNRIDRFPEIHCDDAWLLVGMKSQEWISMAQPFSADYGSGGVSDA